MNQVGKIASILGQLGEGLRERNPDSRVDAPKHIELTNEEAQSKEHWLEKIDAHVHPTTQLVIIIQESFRDDIYSYGILIFYYV